MEGYGSMKALDQEGDTEDCGGQGEDPPNCGCRYKILAVVHFECTKRQN